MYHIIYVDDKKKFQVQFEEQIEKLGIQYTLKMFSNAISAVEYCRSENVDFAFLEIEMPGKSGLWLASQLADLKIPFSFVTSHNNYASEAFNLSAIHYILKPVSAEALKTVIEKYNILKSEYNKKLLVEKLIGLVNSQTNTLSRIFLHNINKTIVLDTDKIIFFSAIGSYTKIVDADGQSHTSTKTLKYYDDILKGQPDFVRIHRANLINKKYVKLVRRDKHKIFILMTDGSELEVSPAYRDTIYDMLS